MFKIYFFYLLSLLKQMPEQKVCAHRRPFVEGVPAACSFSVIETSVRAVYSHATVEIGAGQRNRGDPQYVQPASLRDKVETIKKIISRNIGCDQLEHSRTTQRPTGTPTFP